MHDYPMSDDERARLADVIDREWYARTVPDGDQAQPRERAIRCRYVFTPDAGPDLAFERCPADTLHVSALCELHRQRSEAAA